MKKIISKMVTFITSKIIARNAAKKAQLNLRQEKISVLEKKERISSAARENDLYQS